MTLMDGDASAPVYAGEATLSEATCLGISVHLGEKAEEALQAGLAEVETRFLALVKESQPLLNGFARRVLGSSSLAGYQALIDFRSAHPTDALEQLAAGMQLSDMIFFADGTVEIWCNLPGDLADFDLTATLHPDSTLAEVWFDG